MRLTELSIDSTLKKFNLLFKLTGVVIERKKKNYWGIFMLYHNLITLQIDLLAALWFLFDGMANGSDFVKLTLSAPCITYTVLSNFKISAYIFNEETMDNLIEHLREMESRNEITKDKENIVKEEITFLHKLIKMLNIAYSALIVLFAMNPLSIIVYKYYTLNKLELILPYLAKYPFNEYDIRIWPFAYIHQVYAVVVVILNLMTIDYMFYTYASYIRVQFRLLQHEIERAMSDSVIRTFKGMEAKLCGLVKWHIELIQLSSHLEAAYTKSTLFNFLTSSVLICLTGFDILVINDVAIAISFMSFLFINLLQIFFLCFFGDLLSRASMEVGDGVYKSQWHTKDHQVGRFLLIVLTRAQKACKLTAYNFADINLMAFTRILRNAWSYFALLKTIYG